MKFVRTRDGFVNLDHVAAFETHTRATKGEPYSRDTYKALSATGELLGIVNEADINGLEGLPENTVPNTIAGCAVIEFWFNDDGSYHTTRWPVLAWDLHRDWAATPVCLEELTDTPYEVWVLELPEGYAPRYVIPQHCSFETFEHAAEYAVKQFEKKRAKEAAA